jgi:uncharacterized small protein (DUF1192 family)
MPAGPAAAQQRAPAEAPTARQLAELQERIATLESRIAALEAEKSDIHPGGEAIDRVALLADRAMRNLVDMVRVLKHGREDDAL